MLHTINIRIERDVLRFEAPEPRIFSTVPATMLTNAEGLILRTGMRPYEWEEINSADDVTVPPHLRFVKPLDEPRDVKVAARFLHHVTYEFVRQLRDSTGRGSWFTDRVDCNIAVDELSDSSFVEEVARELKSLPMFQRCSVNGTEVFAKGSSNQPAMRFLTIACMVIAACALVLLPLFAIDEALDHSPAWRRMFLGGLALLTAGAAIGFVIYEKRRGNIGVRSIVFVAAITTLTILQLLSGMVGAP